MNRTTTKFSPQEFLLGLKKKNAAYYRAFHLNSEAMRSVALGEPK